MRRHLGIPRDGEAGVTLVELLVVLTLFSVVGGIVIAGVLGAFQVAHDTNQRVDAIQEIESAQRRIVQDLRSATTLLLPANDDADLSSDLTVRFTRAGEVTDVHYHVLGPDEESDEPARLVRDDGTQTLVTILDNEGPVPLFTYLDARGGEIECDDAGGLACLGASRVLITIVRDIPGKPPVRSNTEVTIRNIRFISS